MAGGPYEAAVVVTVVAGTIASVLTLIVAYQYRKAPARAVFGLLAAFVLLGTAYHVCLLLGLDDYLAVIGHGSFGLETVKTVMYTLLAAFVLGAIVFNRALVRRAGK